MGPAFIYLLFFSASDNSDDVDFSPTEGGSSASRSSRRSKNSKKSKLGNVKAKKGSKPGKKVDSGSRKRVRVQVEPKCSPAKRIEVDPSPVKASDINLLLSLGGRIYFVLSNFRGLSSFLSVLFL